MPQLVAPRGDVHASFLAALREFHREGRHRDIDAVELSDGARFQAFVESVLAQALPGTPRPEGWVPATVLWYVDDREYLGRLSIRHCLTGWLRTLGGHIGYEVRPAARRVGHASQMLALARPVVHALGIDPALITCDVDNVASRRVIEHNGGRFEDRCEGKLRYWWTTGPEV